MLDQLPVPLTCVMEKFASPLMVTVLGGADPPVTVAVMVTDSPTRDGFGLVVIAVVVAVLPAATSVTLRVTLIRMERELVALIVLRANGTSFGTMGTNSFETVTSTRLTLPVNTSGSVCADVLTQ